MESGSNKSLYTLIAVVVFGIFLSLSYFLFQDQLKGVLASVTQRTSEHTETYLKPRPIEYVYADSTSIKVVADKFSDSYTLTSTGSGGGSIIPLTKLDYVLTKEYVLSFDITLNSGSIQTLGGHLQGVAKVYINDVLTPERTYIGANPWASGVPVNLPIGSTLHVNVVFSQPNWDTQYADSPIKIQPNRDWGSINNGYGSPYSATITNLSITPTS